MKTKLICLLITGLGIISLSGCLEHRFQVRLNNDGSVEAGYRLEGTPSDFGGDHFLLPDSARWQLKRTTENREDETVERLEASATISRYDSLRHYFDWRNSPADTIFLIPELTLDRRWHIAGQRWTFRAVLPSRRFKEFYGDETEFIPPECAALLENDSLAETLPPEEVSRLEKRYAMGILQWNNERYLRRFDQVWEAVNKADTDLPAVAPETFSIARAAWAEDLHRYLNQMDVPADPELMNLEWWAELKPLFLGHFVDLLGAEQIPVVIVVAEASEREYQISKSLKTDSYQVRSRLPGIRLKSPPAEREGEWLIWKCSGEELLNEDRSFFAASFQPSYWRVALVLALAFIAAILLVRRMRRRGGSGSDG